MSFYPRRAQSIMEYALLLAVVISAFLAMQVYLKRGLQGRLRDSSDFVIATMKEKAGSRPPGAAADANEYTNQFEPAYRISNTNIHHESSLLEKMSQGGNTAKYYLDDRTNAKRKEEIKQVVSDDQDE